MSSENRTKRGRYCVGPGCKNYESGLKNNLEITDTICDQQSITYHHFPTKTSLRNKWFKFIGHNNRNKISSATWRTWTLCSEHFEASEFEESCQLGCTDSNYRQLRIKLKNGAIPTKKILPPPPPPTPEIYVNQKQTETNMKINIQLSPKNNLIGTILNKEMSNIKNECNEIDCDNETIFTEIDEDFHSKCGEVFVTRKGIFIYFCTFCNENLENSQQFINHIYQEHLSLDNKLRYINTKKSDSINNNKNNKNQEINKLSSIDTNNTPLLSPHCEIVENEAGNFETISFFDIADDDNDNNTSEIDNQNAYSEIETNISEEEFKTPKIHLKNNSIISPTQNLNFDNVIDLTIEEDDSENIIYEDDKISVKNEAALDLNNSNIENSTSNIIHQINSEISNNNNDHCAIKTNISKNDNKKIRADKAHNEADDDDDDNANSNDDDDDWHPTKKRFKCRYCPKILKSQLSINIHNRGHTGERPYKCNVCEQSFKSQSILYYHERKHTGVKPFECKICGLKFSTQYYLNLHQKRHETQQNQYKCAYCDKKFLRLKKKVLHQRSHNIDIKHDPDEDINMLTKNFKCEFCFKTLSSLNTLMDHRRIHTGEKPFPCKFCASAFRSKLLRIVHERSIHTGERPYSCIYCDKTFVTQGTRANHERTHTKERPYKCNLCDKSYRQASSKNIHMKTHYRVKTENGSNGRRRFKSAAGGSVHSDNRKIYKCEYCEKVLSTQTILTEHRRIHTGEKPYACDKCDMKFRAKSLLFNHYHGHSGEKPFECEFCHKRFILAGSLAVHRRIHTGERPFHCSYCDKSFRQKQTKIIHEKTHIRGYTNQSAEKQEDKRIWKCDICDKILINKYSLTNHLRIHSGERPFKCSFCPSAFRTLSQHIQHERIHSGVKPYKCSECNKEFATKSQINVHMRTHEAKKLKPTSFKCDKCEKEFKFNSNLVMHQRIHKDKSESK